MFFKKAPIYNSNNKYGILRNQFNEKHKVQYYKALLKYVKISTWMGQHIMFLRRKPVSQGSLLSQVGLYIQCGKSKVSTSFARKLKN